MVEQLGLATIPSWRSIASGFTSATTSGTFGSIRQAEELSTTTQFSAANRGAHSFEIVPPAENSATSKPSTGSEPSSRTSSAPEPNGSDLPADRADAYGTTSDTGSPRLPS